MFHTDHSSYIPRQEKQGLNVRKLHTVVVEDDAVQALVIKSFTDRIPELGPVEFHADPLTALETIRAGKVDLLLLDIGLPGMTGFELLERLPKRPHVVIITGDSRHALAGFEEGVVDLLVKPFTLERLLRSVRRAASRARKGATEVGPINAPAARTSVLALRSGRRTLRIPASSVLMAEALGNHVKLHLQDRLLVVNSTMRGIEELLPKDRFIRVHRSYIVALDTIVDVMNDTLFTKQGDVPVGTLYRKDLLERVQTFRGQTSGPTVR
jgi:DNA-binding LytR/AlgR family response regulator